MDSIFSISDWMISNFPGLRVQDNSVNLQFFDPKSFNSSTLLISLGCLFILILLLIVITVKYKKWKKYNQFLQEMRSLDLDPGSEGTLAWMVKRYQMNEPVKVLHSAETFDQMASGEIFRILCSAGTAEAKQNFIDTIYDIRNRTFHPNRFF